MRLWKEIFLNSEENKKYEITIQQNVLKRGKWLHHSSMTSHRPPMWHGFCFTGISFESIFSFFHYYCQFQEDLLSSFDNCNQCSKHALKKLATSHVSSRRRNHFWIGNFVLWHLRAASRHIRPRPARSVSGFICLVVLGGWRSEKVKRGSTPSPPPLSRLIDHSEAHGVKTYLSPLSTDSLSTQQMSYFFLG